MEKVSIADENWQVVLSLLPSNWKELGQETGALNRRLRNFPTIESIIRLLFIHFGRGYSLRETVALANQAGIAKVSDVALLKRLRASEHWLKALCFALFSEVSEAQELTTHGIRMRAVDASNVREPGKTGSQWRIHYSVTLPDLECDQFELTPVKGIGHGETLKQFHVSKGDCIIGDRAYSTNSGIAYLDKNQAYCLVRVNTAALVLQGVDEAPFSLFDHIKTLKETGCIGEWPVLVKDKESGRIIKGRVCAVKKSEHAAQKAIKKIKKEAAKRQRTPKKETLEFAKYIITFTTLPAELFSAQAVLNWYRIRWQIELVFKRLKSLAKLGHLPKYDEASSRAWLYGKLLLGLLTEKLIRQTGAFSPWGYDLNKSEN